MLYKTILQQYCKMIDGVMQSLKLIYTQIQKPGMSILGDAKSYYVKTL